MARSIPKVWKEKFILLTWGILWIPQAGRTARISHLEPLNRWLAIVTFDLAYFPYACGIVSALLQIIWPTIPMLYLPLTNVVPSLYQCCTFPLIVFVFFYFLSSHMLGVHPIFPQPWLRYITSCGMVRGWMDAQRVLFISFTVLWLGVNLNGNLLCDFWAFFVCLVFALDINSYTPCFNNMKRVYS